MHASGDAFLECLLTLNCDASVVAMNTTSSYSVVAMNTTSSYSEAKRKGNMLFGQNRNIQIS